MEPVRLGFVGCGGICRLRHLPGFQRIPGVEFMTVANRSRESSEEVAQEECIREVADSWRDVVHHPEVDAVVVGTWPYLHHPVSIAALGAGKHVFCQARMAMNAREAREMRDAARAADKVAALCPVPFGLGVDKTVLRLQREGKLGEIHLVQVESLSDAWLDPNNTITWRKDHRLSGLNVLTLGMCVEVIHRWFGITAEVSSTSQIFTPVRKEITGTTLEVRIPDQVLLNTRLVSGAAVQYVISGMARVPRDTVTIHGSKACLSYDAKADALNWRKAGDTLERIEVLPEDAYDTEDWRVEQDFIDAIRNGTPYHPDFEDGYRYMQVVDATAVSADSGKTVRLALD